MAVTSAETLLASQNLCGAGRGASMSWVIRSVAEKSAQHSNDEMAARGSGFPRKKDFPRVDKAVLNPLVLALYIIGRRSARRSSPQLYLYQTTDMTYMCTSWSVTVVPYSYPCCINNTRKDERLDKKGILDYIFNDSPNMALYLRSRVTRVRRITFAFASKVQGKTPGQGDKKPVPRHPAKVPLQHYPLARHLDAATLGAVPNASRFTTMG